MSSSAGCRAVFPVGVALLLVGVKGPAAAGDEVRVDWQRGTVTATGAAPGDLRAPTPAVARTKARRLARDAAQRRLREAARSLPWAAGGSLENSMDPGGQDELERAIEGAVVRQEIFGADGSVRLQLAVGLEALRASLQGPLPVTPETPEVAALVVDATRTAVQPSLGVALAVSSQHYAGPTLWFRRRGDLAAAAKKASATSKSKVLRVQAAGFDADSGRLQLSGLSAAELEAARLSGAVILIRFRPRPSQ